MGDPRKIRSKYSRPGHPWRAERIAEERKLLQQYGLKNKTEIWRAQSLLKSFTAQAKKLIAATGAQAQKERSQLISRLVRLGLVEPNAGLDDVLGLTLNDLFERRLQTLVYKKGFAKSIRQARQFITHEHIVLGNKKITAPSYLVSVAEEPSITFVSSSTLANPEHPERKIIPPKPVIVAKAEGKS